MTALETHVPGDPGGCRDDAARLRRLAVGGRDTEQLLAGRAALPLTELAGLAAQAYDDRRDPSSRLAGLLADDARAAADGLDELAGDLAEVRAVLRRAREAARGRLRVDGTRVLPPADDAPRDDHRLFAALATGVRDAWRVHDAAQARWLHRLDGLARGPLDPGSPPATGDPVDVPGPAGAWPPTGPPWDADPPTPPTPPASAPAPGHPVPAGGSAPAVVEAPSVGPPRVGAPSAGAPAAPPPGAPMLFVVAAVAPSGPLGVPLFVTGPGPAPDPWPPWGSEPEPERVRRG